MERSHGDTVYPTAQLPFHPFGRREVVARFDAGHLTSDGGALLLREAEFRLELTRRIAACFADGRQSGRVERGVQELVAQRVHGLALDRLLVKLSLESHAQAPETVWLDLDATDDPLHGAQEGHFPSDEAATKLIYLALRNITANWKNPPREWHAAKAQFAILFGERFVLTV